MTTSALSGASQTSLVQQLMASLQSTLAGSADGLDPADSAGPADAAGSPPPPPPPKPDATASDLFSSDTLAGLMQAQEQPPSASQAAAKLIAGADTDGSGTLSLAEITQALDGASSTAGDASNASSSTQASSALQAAFAKLDTNGDGQLDQSEIAAGLQKMDHAHRGGGHHHHHAAYAQAAASTDASTTAAAAASTAGAASAATAVTAVTATDLAA